ncbi:MAG: MBOAT family protein [Alphaproteobacteria bacterium]|nr:MBOAT family protein [Alphaproteobacteria bacterium]HPF46965.1 MBOAT family O-acyltransferase [Emcibacteraceae bacterium]HRW29230.1 MBOAT family O-acyltransferase [Emcibacteraceae bacterium]
MLFNSYEFIFVFLPVTFCVYFFLNHKKLTIAANAFLALASLFFYSWWNIIYLPLILSSILFNYYIGQKIHASLGNESSRISPKSILTFGVVVNLALLGYFKYSDFFISNTNLLLGTHFTLLHLVLPLAISFFTFQQISYLVDSYKGKVNEHNFINYSLFVTFFPQLIAGPIVHHKEMMPQFAMLRSKLINYKNIATGLFIFSIGLFKKLVFADTFAKWVYFGYGGTEPMDFFGAWASATSFYHQIYFDYSGYADMAIGLGLMFNIHIPINFLSPPKSKSVKEFWTRWNMTLSRFLRDYIFLPLGGARKGRFRTYLAVMATFLLGGLWHGADWTFVLWGFLHGTAVVICHTWKKYSSIKFYDWFNWFLTSFFLTVTGVLFSAPTWDAAVRVFKGMVAFDKIILPTELEFANNFGIKFGDFLGSVNGDKWTVIWIVFGYIFVLSFKNSIERMKEFKPDLKHLVFLGFTLIIGLLYITRKSEFLYYNF